MVKIPTHADKKTDEATKKHKKHKMEFPLVLLVPFCGKSFLDPRA